MAWKLRTHGHELFHHIYAWGNDRQPVFKEQFHYQEYLRLLEQFTNKYSIEIVSYALMQWHVHLFIHDPEDNISDFMMNLHGSYAQFYNKTASHVGHVFGERFNNKIVIPNVYGMWLTRYIHRQALDANLVTDPTDYPWTSYHEYINKRAKRIFIKPEIILNQFGDIIRRTESYINFVLGEDEGPIDWNAKVLTIRSRKALLKFVCDQNEILEPILLHPKGDIERNRRKEMIIKLNTFYSLNGSQISQMLNISRTSVANILNLSKS